MQKFTAEVKVGLFVVAAIVILAYMTVRIGDLTFGREKGYIIYGVFDSVAGLDVKAPVKMAGVEIGSVETIGLTDSRAKVGMRIRQDIKIKKGVVAAVKSESLLGEKFVEINQGSGDVFLREGDMIEISVSVADIDTLITRLDSVAKDMKSISGFFSETLGSPETKRSINEIISNMRNLTSSLAKVAERDSSAIERVIEGLDEMIALFKDVAEENREPLRNVIVNLEGISNDLNVIAKENKEPLKTTVANLYQVSEDLKERTPRILEGVDRLVEGVEKGEGTVGKFMKEGGLYDKLDSTLTGVDKYISAADRFTLNVGFRGEYLFDEDDTKGYFSLKLQPREDKYYLFEVIDDPQGRVKVTDTEVTMTPGTTVKRHEVKREDELKFSAQFAKKFGSVAFRGGLMEDTFGVGADYYLNDDKIKASLEAWNFGGDADAENPHMKLTASYTAFKALFIRGGVDDFANSKRTSAFAGAGLSFDDEDLKYIMTRLPVTLP
ncbi:MAG: MCE family protein [Nitrospirae bacterium]|nr:MCE family protein [Nitrospirota bacterium]